MKILLYLLIGLGIGTVSGMLGIGGGVLLVPALVWLCGFDFKKAAGTTLAILVPPIGLPAAWRAFNEQRVDLQAAVCVAAAFAIGAYGGALTVRYVPEHFLRWAFGAVMIYIAVRFMLSSSSEAVTAAAGLVSVALASLAYFGLRALGRKHLAPPDLGQHIREVRQGSYGEPDYHI